MATKVGLRWLTKAGSVVETGRMRSCVMVLRLWKRDRTSASSPGKGNIMLMGSPGSGKTTVGQLLAERMGMPLIDVDNDHLERHWHMAVSQKLSQVGGDTFIQEEGEALLQLKVSNSVISLTGSNPMHKAAMDYVRSTGVVVYLDVPRGDIIQRLDRMKVDRIVGQEQGTPMEDILHHRQQFYEASYDIRIICENSESPVSICDKVFQAVRRFQNSRGYVSTRGRDSNNKQPKEFNRVVLDGLAPDGGLYVPADDLPRLCTREWQRLLPLTFQERALRVLEQWIHPHQLHPSSLRAMIHKAYSTENFQTPDIFPVRHLCDNVYLLELFHGPTASFKDAALQLMPQFFAQALEKEGGQDKYLILVATSGDTGGAVLDGFAKYAGVRVKVQVLYPEEGISSIQKKQMTSALGSKVSVIGVQSDFDYCQTTIKKIFTNSKLNNDLIDKTATQISAANSINWGRLLPQVVYYCTAYLDMASRGVVAMGDPIDVCIPTGNFGNILGAFYAKKMGIPFNRIICASNMNNVLTDFLQTGRYDLRSRSLHLTASPAIDILKSSNLERYLYHKCGKNPNIVRSLYRSLEERNFFTVSRKILPRIHQDFTADCCSETECIEEIANTFNNTGYMLDPHTAIAKVVADRQNDQRRPMLIVSTAHPAKFAPAVLRAAEVAPGDLEDIVGLLAVYERLSAEPAMHRQLKESIERPRRHWKTVPADERCIVDAIYSFCEGNT